MSEPQGSATAKYSGKISLLRQTLSDSRDTNTGDLMAQSLPYVRLPPNQWVDLYSETGIVAGAQIVIQNIGGVDARLVEKATAPTLSDGHNIICPRAYLSNEPGNVGAWGYSKTGSTLQVEEV